MGLENKDGREESRFTVQCNWEYLRYVQTERLGESGVNRRGRRQRQSKRQGQRWVQCVEQEELPFRIMHIIEQYKTRDLEQLTKDFHLFDSRFLLL